MWLLPDCLPGLGSNRDEPFGSGPIPLWYLILPAAAAGQPTAEYLRSEVGVHRGAQGVAHIRIVGQRCDQGHLAGGLGSMPLADQLCCVDQQAGGHAFVQAVALEVARAVGDLHQFLGDLLVDATFVGDDLGLDL